MMLSENNEPKTGAWNVSDQRNQWWASRRVKYNAGLLIAGVIAFLAYAILSITLIYPHDPDFEIYLFTILFQAAGYLFMILIANLFYNLGPLIDEKQNKLNSETYRQRLFRLGFWFSICIPFLVPCFIVLEYFLRYQ